MGVRLGLGAALKPGGTVCFRGMAGEEVVGEVRGELGGMANSCAWILYSSLRRHVLILLRWFPFLDSTVLLQNNADFERIPVQVI